MTRWRYFLSVFSEYDDQVQEAAERGEAAIYRLPVGAPVVPLEGLARRGKYEWKPSDRMWRARYLGSDYEFTEITPEAPARSSRSGSRKASCPATRRRNPPIILELAQYLTGLDEQAQAQWRDVPKPPGAEDVTG